MLEKIKSIFSKEEEYDEEYYEEDFSQQEEVNEPLNLHTSNTSQTKLKNIKGGLSEMEIINFAMLNYEMTGDIFNYITKKQPAIVNMEKLETADTQRALDYLSGATKALGGNVAEVAKSIFLFAPENVKINPTKESEYAMRQQHSHNMPQNLSAPTLAPKN